MIDYDPYHWTSHLLDIEGSMVREIIGRVALCTTFGLGVVVLHYMVRTIDISPTTHTLVGVALGMLLVFRTNASYDRFWEGRRMWGSIINESRNLARGTKTYVAPAAPDLAEAIALWTSAFPYAAMSALRDVPGIGPVRDGLPPELVREVLAAKHIPLAVATKISQNLAEAHRRGVISDILLTYLDQNPQLLMDYLGSCERIYRTPLPFVYVVHLRRALFLYCYSLPFALVSLYGWWTVVIVFVLSYTFFGIEEIGVEIENPFGLDSNDLPLTKFCQMIERDVRDALGLPQVKNHGAGDDEIRPAGPKREEAAAAAGVIPG
ncbi:MAG: bestrophin family ion channel [Isosphaeraceae bacterium]